MKWDGTLHKPQTFGKGHKAGTVDDVRRQRQASAHAAHVRRVMDEREEERRQPVRWYLTSHPFWLVRAVGKVVARLGR